jgi:hypothetical protein
MQPPKHPLLGSDLESRISPQRLFGHRPKKWPSYAVALVTIGYCACSPVSLARGHSGGERYGQPNQPTFGNQSQHEGRYWDPFWGPWHPGYAGYYDSDYWYPPTPEQKATAQKRVKDYLVAVKKGRRHPAGHRYIAVETLKPTKQQLQDYEKKRAEAKSAAAAGQTQLSTRWVDPTGLRCMMVFDTQSNQFVGSGCYVVGSLPPVGTVAKFETVTAEYVGTTSL